MALSAQIKKNMRDLTERTATTNSTCIENQKRFTTAYGVNVNTGNLKRKENSEDKNITKNIQLTFSS